MTLMETCLVSSLRNNIEEGGRGRSQHVQLPTHATRARWWRDVRGHSNRLKVSMAIGYSLTKGHALRTGADGIGGVLDVGAGDVGAMLGEQDGADAEVAVGAVCG